MELFSNMDYETDSATEQKIITIYDKDDEDWTTNGLGILRPNACIVTEQAGGQYELMMEHPIDEQGRWRLIENQRVIRCSVPARQDPAAAIEYKSDKVTKHDIRKALKNIKVYNTSTGKKKTISTIKKGSEFVVIDSKTSYYHVKTHDGTVGYCSKGTSYSQFARQEQDDTLVDGEQYNSVSLRRQTRNQCFRIYATEVITQENKVICNARHVSYDCAANLVGSLDMKQNKVLLSTALNRLKSGLLYQDDAFVVGTDITNGYVQGDKSYKNPIEILLDPDDGFVASNNAQFIRDNRAMYLLDNSKPVDRGYKISYGKNLKGLRWSYDDSNLVTRIIPAGQDKKGKRMLLPNGETVDSTHINDYAHVYVKYLDISDAKVGGELKDDYGNVLDKKLTEQECYALMRQRAKEEFDKGCDLPVLDLTVDFVQLETTEEYADFKDLYTLHLYDKVHVSHEPTGYSADAQMKGYEWDAILCRYNSITIGDIFSVDKSTVSGYQISAGTVSGTRIASGTISGSNLQDAAITNAKIGYAAIENANIADATITSAKIHDLNADKITAGLLTTDRLVVTGNASIVGKLNGVAADAIAKGTNNTTNVIGYIANDAITVTDRGLILKSNGTMDIESGADFNIKSGGRFTVDSANFIVDGQGNVEMYSATVDGLIKSNGYNTLTKGDIYIGADKPSEAHDGMIWINPMGGSNAPLRFTTTPKSQVVLSSTKQLFMLTCKGTQPTSPYQYKLTVPIRATLTGDELTANMRASIGNMATAGITVNGTPIDFDSFKLSPSAYSTKWKQLTFTPTVPSGATLKSLKIKVKALYAQGDSYISKTASRDSAQVIHKWTTGDVEIELPTSQRSVYIGYYASVANNTRTFKDVSIVYSYTTASGQTYSIDIDQTVYAYDTKLTTAVFTKTGVSSFVATSSGGVLSIPIYLTASVTGGKVSVLTEQIKLEVIPSAYANKWRQCKAYWLDGDNPNVSIAEDQGNGLKLLWEAGSTARTMSYSEGFTLSDAVSNYKFILMEMTGTYAGTLMIPINAGTFQYSCGSTYDTSKMYFLMGTMRWESQWFKFYYTLRFYKTSYSGGGSSTADPVIGKIYGVR